MSALTITLRSIGVTMWELEAKTLSGEVVAHVRGTWPVVVAALSAFVGQLS